MKIPDDILKCVVFVGFKSSESTYSMAGSGLLLGSDGQEHICIVTAKHVVDAIRTKNLVHVCLRLNKKGSDAEWVETNIDDWKSHKTDSSIDVVVYKCRMNGEYDHLVLPLTYGMTHELMASEEIGLGDEVFVTGLFRHHHGNRRNIPIVRIGNLSCFQEEKVVTRDFGEIDAYLIECRSIGGLSGSPVFVHLGAVRPTTGAVFRIPSQPNRMVFLGIIHGHYDVETSGVDVKVDTGQAGLSVERVNTGIAIVVPFEKIRDTINSIQDESPPP